MYSVHIEEKEQFKEGSLNNFNEGERNNDESVELVDNHKHLDVTFVSDGNWTVHIENIARSALKQVNVLRKLFYLNKLCQMSI